MRTRHSADDRRGDPRRSPFRSEDPGVRVEAALDMIEKREAEIEHLERLIANTHGAERRRLGTRLRATKNNLQSWFAYLDEDEEPRRVRGAVIIP